MRMAISEFLHADGPPDSLYKVEAAGSSPSPAAIDSFDRHRISIEPLQPHRRPAHGVARGLRYPSRRGLDGGGHRLPGWWQLKSAIAHLKSFAPATYPAHARC